LDPLARSDLLPDSHHRRYLREEEGGSRLDGYGMKVEWRLPSDLDIKSPLELQHVLVSAQLCAELWDRRMEKRKIL
jgi:hypothetical protein